MRAQVRWRRSTPSSLTRATSGGDSSSRALHRDKLDLLATRDALDYDEPSRTAILGQLLVPRHPPRIAIVCGGTSDVAVAGEAARTLAFAGEASSRFVDVGVAGLWRLMEHLDDIRAHRIVIVVAGMEGALFSVLAGLVSSAVIAVPTSVGYGVAAGGQAALSAALASCASGIAVVNIDNGFGAAHVALRMLGEPVSGAVQPAEAGAIEKR